MYEEYIYYYDRSHKQWYDIANRPMSYETYYRDYRDNAGIPCNPALSLDLTLASKDKSTDKFIIIRNKIYPGIPTSRLYILLDDTIRFVGKTFIYKATNGSRTCIPKEYVINTGVLKKIKTQYPYVVDLLDIMQRDRYPGKDNDDANKIRAKNIFNNELYEDQQMYYLMEGDCQYL